MQDLIKKLHNHSFTRYFIMAVFVVLIELIVFQALNSLLSMNYIIPTILSMIVGILLNWIFSRSYVFKTSKYSKQIEFVLIVATSLVGVAIQVGTIYLCVELIKLIPIVGKFFAISVTFFWNYFIRKKYIF